MILKFSPLGPPTSAAYDFNASLCSCDNDGEDSHKKHLQEMFNRLAGKDKEIDAEELQDILTISLKQGSYTTATQLNLISHKNLFVIIFHHRQAYECV